MTFTLSIFITLTFEYYNQLLRFELICAKLGFNVNSCIQHCIQNNCLAKYKQEDLFGYKCSEEALGSHTINIWYNTWQSMHVKIQKYISMPHKK